MHLTRKKLRLLQFSFIFLTFLTGSSCKEGEAKTVKTPPHIIGADVSFVPQMEARGNSDIDIDGNEKDVLEILAAHNFDNIRLRIFVNPEAENGYSKDGFCDLENTLKMAKRIKNAGMDFTLDFHYSDYWADPDKQYKPSSWEGLEGTELEDQLYQYTKKVLDTLKAENVAPKIVQVGNEINHGMVWPDGKVMDDATEEDWASLMGLYKAGEKAVREVLPEAKIMVHLALGGQNTMCHQFLDKMKEHGATYDIIGLSYYER